MIWRRAAAYSVDDAVAALAPPDAGTGGRKVKPNFEPLLHPVEIADLRPTQMTVGLREVARKRSEWRKRAERDGPDFLGRHMIPAVIGPGNHVFLVDHHHLVRALHEEGVEHVLVSIVADLGGLKRSAFWTFMDNRNWLHPFDATASGAATAASRRRSAISRTIPIARSPARSAAPAAMPRIRRPSPNSSGPISCAAAIDAKLVDKHFERAVGEALDLAHGEDARLSAGLVRAGGLNAMPRTWWLARICLLTLLACMGNAASTHSQKSGEFCAGSRGRRGSPAQRRWRLRR